MPWAPATAASEPAPAPSTASAPLASSSARSYTIASGDTLSAIADRFNVTLEELLAANPSIEDPNQILIGQELSIPAPPTAPESTLTWQNVPSDVAVAGGAGLNLSLTDIARVPGGFVAVGHDWRGGIILRSPDGVQWTPAPDDGSFDGSSIPGVARGTTLTIAVGKDAGSNAGVLWASTDGTTWRHQEGALKGSTSVTDIAAGGGSYVVAGSIRLPAGASGKRRTVAAIWASRDGTTWAMRALPSAPATDDFRATLVRYAGGRFVAFGSFLGSSESGQVLTWTSSDGLHWERGQDVQLPAGSSLLDVATLPDGRLVTVGGGTWWNPRTVDIEASRALAYTSVDGLAWTAAPAQASLDGAVMRGIDCDAASCIAVGGAWNALSWTTVDGEVWTRVASTEALGNGSLEGVVLTQAGAIAVGRISAFAAPDETAGAVAAAVAPPRQLPAPVSGTAVATIAGRWETLPSLPAPRSNAATAAGVDGRIYVFGGANRPAGATQTLETNSVEVFDPAAQNWFEGPPIPGPALRRAAAVTEPDGRIFLFHHSSSTVLVYDPGQETWATGPAVPDRRYVRLAFAVGHNIWVETWHGAVPLQLYVLDPATGRWTSHGALSTAAQAAGADGTLYGFTTTRAWAIDPEDGSSATRAPSPVLLDGTMVWAAGPDGLIWGVGSKTTLAYDPAANRWYVAPPPTEARSGHALVGVGDRLYAIGRSTGTTPNSVEVLLVTGR